MADLGIPLTLAGLGLVLIVLEMFIPSAGVLGSSAAFLLASSVLLSFYYGGSSVGTVFMVATTAMLALMLALLIRWWPHTKFGRMILINSATAENPSPRSAKLASLVGRYGRAKSLLIPGGTVEIDGRRFDALGVKTIEPGTWVRVTAIQGNDLIVKPLSEEEGRRIDKQTPPGGGTGDLDQPSFEDPFDEPSP